MFIERSSTELATLRREAERGAARLVRRLGLTGRELDDLQQDLLVDLFSRLKDFDPMRGRLSAFAAVVVRHRAALIAARMRRHRTMFAWVSIDDPIGGRDNQPLVTTLADEDGYLAMMGNCTNPIAELENRLSVNRALETLSPEQLRLCADLEGGAIQHTGTATGASRATVYRQRRDLRLCLLAAGLEPRA
jgi:DNA-directed RNA polymerase specialized sigma24 family protein